MSSVHIDQLIIRHEGKILVDCGFEIVHSLALVGQSGSGKSLILKALLEVSDPSISVEYTRRCDFEWARGKSVSLVPQNPFTAFSPLTRIKDQMFLSHERCAELFGWLGLDMELLKRYPSELSGGQLQRIVVAIALGSSPSLLLLDEPTTALDGASKLSMIELLRLAQEKIGFKMLFVTHEIEVARALCEYVCVLDAGHIIERGAIEDVVHNPQTSMTKRLIEADFKNREFRQ
jgi:peptide/nickel transport system ATP-binding protein